METESRKTLVVGIDAATWDVLDPLLEAGRLPNIAAIVDEGVRGTLQSTTPPMTPLAWTSIATGVNPGKHGVYDFLKQDQETYEVTPTDYTEMSRPTVWDLLAESGKRAGVVNYPAFEPPSENTAFFVPGIPRRRAELSTHPSSVATVLDEFDYRVHPSASPDDGTRAYYEAVRDLTETQLEVTLELFDEHDVDVLWPVFMGVDWIQHYLWGETIGREDAVERFYEYVDTVVGRLRDAVGPDWHTVLLSDHGATPIEGVAHLDSLLAELGYLSSDDDTRIGRQVVDSLLSGAWQLGRRLPPSVKRFLKEWLTDESLNRARAAGGAGQLDLHNQVDWSATTAFAYGNMGQIFSHNEDRYPLGTVADDDDLLHSVKTELETVTDDDGRPLFETVEFGSDVYDGPHAADGPDLVARPRDWSYTLYGDFETPWLHPPGKRVADHHPRGVVAAAGPEVPVGGSVGSVAVTDVAPTLLCLHGAPLVDDMDGSVVSDLFWEGEPPTPTTHPVEAIETTQSDRTDASGVEERLEELGYL